MKLRVALLLTLLPAAAMAQLPPGRSLAPADITRILGSPPLLSGALGAPNGVPQLDANAGTGFGGAGLTPTVRLNGIGAGRGVQWQNNGIARFGLQTDGSDNLCLYAYGDAGAYLNAPVCFNRNSQSTLMTGLITLTNTGSGPDSTGIGQIFAAHNTGTMTGAIGATFQYASNADAPNFDVGTEAIATFDPTAFSASQLTAGANATGPAEYEEFKVAVSPNDQTHNFGIAIAEWDIVNRGPDTGFKRDRSTQPVTGGLLMVPEVTAYDTTGGEGKNATFAYSASRSAGTNSTTFPAHFHTDYLCEPNSEAGVDGRCMYATGDITGTPSQIPYAPIQFDGAWLHGFDTTLATFGDSLAVHLAAGQMVGIGAATIGAGVGANGNLLLTAGGTGFVQSLSTTEVGANAAASANLLINGAATTSRTVSYQTAGSSVWSEGPTSTPQSGNNVGADFALNRFSDTGGYLGAPLFISRATGLVSVSSGLSVANGLTADTVTATGAVQFQSVAYASLPATGAAGREVFCSNCLKPGESANVGTGMLVFDDGHSHWVSTAGTVAAH